MFKELANFGAILQQAKQMSGRMQQIQEDLKKARAVGTAGGSMVEVEVNGLLEVCRCRLSEQLLAEGDREMTEDLIVAAANQAMAKARQMQADAMGGLTGGLELPGLKDALAKFFPGGAGGGPVDS